MSQATKKLIIETFIKLLSVKSMDKITVKDIVEECEINRNTFYYYYKDIYDLTDDIFAMEIEKMLSVQINYDSWQEDIYRIVDFVINNNNKNLVLHLYQSKSRDVLEKYIFTMAGTMVSAYIKRHDLEHITDEKNTSFVCDFYKAAIAGIMLEWIKGGMQTDSEEFVKKLANIIENTVKVALEKC